MTSTPFIAFLVKKADLAETIAQTVSPSVPGERYSSWSPTDWLYGLMGRTVPGQDPASGISHTQAAQDNARKAQTMRTIGNLGLLGLGAGAVGTGLYHGAHWLMPSDPVKAEAYGSPEPDVFQYPQTPEQALSEKERAALKRRGLLKKANPTAPPVPPVPRGTTTEITSDWSYPWAIPAGGLSLFLGGLGGYHLADWLARKRRKADVESDLTDARKEYEETLLQEYDPRQIKPLAQPFKPKMASEVKDPLDRAFDLYQEKKADVGELLRNLFGTGLGAYGLAALGVGLPAGMVGYSLARGQDSRKVMNDVLAQRLRLRAAVSPLEMGFTPEAVPVPPGKIWSYDQDEDEEEEETPPTRAQKR